MLYIKKNKATAQHGQILASRGYEVGERLGHWEVNASYVTEEWAEKKEVPIYGLGTLDDPFEIEFEGDLKEVFQAMKEDKKAFGYHHALILPGESRAHSGRYLLKALDKISKGLSCLVMKRNIGNKKGGSDLPDLGNLF